MAAWARPVYGPKASPSCFGVDPPTDLPVRSPYALGPALPIAGGAYPSASPHRWITPPRRYGNVDPLSFAYACRPRLRDRLTLGGLTFPRNPWAFGDQVFHLVYRYSCRDHLFRLVQQSSRSAFNLARNAPLPSGRLPRPIRSFGDGLEPR